MAFDLKALGARISRIREYWRMSQAELAEYTSFPLDVIVSVENGELEPPPGLMVGLRAVFRLEISDIIGDTFSFRPLGAPPEPAVKRVRKRI